MVAAGRDHRSWWLCRSCCGRCCAGSCARRSRSRLFCAAAARRQGLRAITRGLIAVGAGDVRRRGIMPSEASSWRPASRWRCCSARNRRNSAATAPPPSAPSARWPARDDTKLLGLRGLFIEAQRRDDSRSARPLCRRSREDRAVAVVGGAGGAADSAARPATGPARSRCSNATAQRRCSIARAYRRQRAVLLTARALAAEESDRDTAKSLVFEAVKLAPDLVPAAALGGTLPRRSRRPAQGHAHDRESLAAPTRIPISPRPMPICASAIPRATGSTRVADGWLRNAPGKIEGALALARAAIDAREFALARRTHCAAPDPADAARRTADGRSRTGRHGDAGRAREWTARAVHAARDPAWTADGFVSERWLPVSPMTGPHRCVRMEGAARRNRRTAGDGRGGAKPAPVIDATAAAEPAEIGSHRSEEKAPASILSRRDAQPARGADAP